MIKQKVQVKKGLKKSFYEVEAPLTAVKINLYGNSIEDLDGRVVKLDLTKSLRGKSLELKMKVKNEGGKLKAMPVSLKLVASYIRRNMRRGSDYVEDSFIVECRDIVARIKPFLITRMKVSRAVRKALRDACRKYIEAHVKIRNRKELISDIMANKLQKGLSVKLKKTYPLALCEIRVFEVISEKDVKDKVEVMKEKDGEKVKEESEMEDKGVKDKII